VLTETCSYRPGGERLLRTKEMIVDQRAGLPKEDQRAARDREGDQFHIDTPVRSRTTPKLGRQEPNSTESCNCRSDRGNEASEFVAREGRACRPRAAYHAGLAVNGFARSALASLGGRLRPLTAALRREARCAGNPARFHASQGVQP
jgi:hypothetical protein